MEYDVAVRVTWVQARDTAKNNNLAWRYYGYQSAPLTLAVESLVAVVGFSRARHD